MRLRTMRRVSQLELAEALGVSRQTVSSWENGHSEPNLTIKQFKTLLKVLEIKAEDLPETLGPQPIHNTSPFFNRRAGDNSN
jgi:transcriptional regulator with XRE-family HTH domain